MGSKPDSSVKQQPYGTDRGFTLVELAVVLVIIGLIVAAVEGSQSLIKAAQLRQVIAEVGDYQSAFNLFTEKHRNYPGDFPTAANVWASADNGNGNGRIEWALVSGNNESIMAWQQFVLEGLIVGTYTGKTTTNAIPGTSIPASALRDNVGYRFDYDTTDPPFFPGNVLVLGQETTAQTNENNENVFNNKDAWTIDRKMDDGLPGAGLVRAGTETGGSLQIGCDTGSAYDISASELVRNCFMTFRMD